MSIDQENLLALDAQASNRNQDASEKLQADCGTRPMKGHLSKKDDPFDNVARANELLLKKGVCAAADEYQEAINAAYKLDEQTLYKALRKELKKAGVPQEKIYDMMHKMRAEIEFDVAVSALGFGLKFKNKDVILGADMLMRQAAQDNPEIVNDPRKQAKLQEAMRNNLPQGLVQAAEQGQLQQAQVPQGQPADLQRQTYGVPDQAGMPADQAGRMPQVSDAQAEQMAKQMMSDTRNMVGSQSLQNMQQGMKLMADGKGLAVAKPCFERAIALAGPVNQEQIQKNLLHNLQQAGVAIDPSKGEVQIDQEKARRLAPMAHMLAMAPIYVRESTAAVYNNNGDHKGALRLINELPKDIQEKDPMARLIKDRASKGQKISEADFQALAQGKVPAQVGEVSKTSGNGAVEKGNYTVKKGDTLFEIAGGNQKLMHQIGEANHIKDLNKIYTGQHLVIPGLKSMETSHAASAKPAQAKAAEATVSKNGNGEQPQAGTEKQPAVSEKQQVVGDKQKAAIESEKKEISGGAQSLQVMAEAEEIRAKSGDAAALAKLEESVKLSGPLDGTKVHERLAKLGTFVEKAVDLQTGKKISDKEAVAAALLAIPVAVAPVLSRVGYASALNNTGKHEEAKAILTEVNKQFPEAKELCNTDIMLDLAGKKQQINDKTTKEAIGADASKRDEAHINTFAKLINVDAKVLKDLKAGATESAVGAPGSSSSINSNLVAALTEWQKAGKLTDTSRLNFNRAIDEVGASVVAEKSRIKELTILLEERIKASNPVANDVKKYSELELNNRAKVERLQKEIKGENILEQAGDLWHKAWNDKQDKGSELAKAEKELKIAKKIKEEKIAELNSYRESIIEPLKKQINELSNKVWTKTDKQLSEAQMAYGYALAQSKDKNDKDMAKDHILAAGISNPEMVMKKGDAEKKEKSFLEFADSVGVKRDSLVYNLIAKGNTFSEDSNFGVKSATPYFKAAIEAAGAVESKSIETKVADAKKAFEDKVKTEFPGANEQQKQILLKNKVETTIASDPAIASRTVYAHALNKAGDFKASQEVLKEISSKYPDAMKGKYLALLDGKNAKGQSLSEEEFRQASDKSEQNTQESYFKARSADQKDFGHVASDTGLQLAGNIGSGALGMTAFTVANAALASIPATGGLDAVPAGLVAAGGYVVAGLCAAGTAIASKQAFNAATHSGENDKWYYAPLNVVPFGVYRGVAAGGEAVLTTGLSKVGPVGEFVKNTPLIFNTAKTVMPYTAAAGAYSFPRAGVDHLTGATSPLDGHKYTPQELYVGAAFDTAAASVAGPIFSGAIRAVPGSKIVDKFVQNGIRGSYAQAGKLPVGPIQDFTKVAIGDVKNNWKVTADVLQTIPVVQSRDMQAVAQYYVNALDAQEAERRIAAGE